MLCVCAAFVIPLYYLVVSTFKTQSAIVALPLGLPLPPTLDNYRRAFEVMSFFRNFGNSTLITSVSVVLIVVFGSLAAYSIARRKTRLMAFLGIYFLIGFMVPVQTTLIPLFRIMKILNLINRYGGMIFLHSNGCVFAILLYRGFIKTVPLDLEESAFLDGASPFRTFWQIVFPLIQPITATLIIFNVMWIWNDFLLTYLFLSSTKKATLIMQVYNGIGLYMNDWSLMMPVLVLALAPMVVFYLLMQKRIIGGLTSGAIKG
jgi:raffinose/stachyose/melibiose transport system permease protein